MIEHVQMSSAAQFLMITTCTRKYRPTAVLYAIFSFTSYCGDVVKMKFQNCVTFFVILKLLIPVSNCIKL